MEDKKSHPSLPSNYVTLAQLQERWLKQQQMKQNEEQQLQEQQEHQQELLHPQQQDPPQQGDEVVAVRRHGTASRSASKNHCAKQYRPKIRNDSASNRRTIEVSSENHRKFQVNAGIGDANADLNSEGNKLKTKKGKKKVERKPRADKGEKGTNEGAGKATMEGDKEAEKSKAKKGDDEKITVKSELNDKRGNGIVEVEQKFGAISMNSENGKQNGSLRSVPHGFRHSHSQSQRICGGRGYGHGHGHGHRPFGRGFRRQHQEPRKGRGDKMVWVRKDGNVGGIETLSSPNS